MASGSLVKMPVVQPVASKFLAQKWDAELFRTHRMRVGNAISTVDNSKPREFPHLKLALNKIAIEEQRLSRYDRENQLLLKKIRLIVKGHGTIENWNSFSQKDLHALARRKRQQEIEIENQAMLRRIQAAKPVVEKSRQLEQFNKHKTYQQIIKSSIKDYNSPRIKDSTNERSSEASGNNDTAEDETVEEPENKKNEDVAPTNENENTTEDLPSNQLKKKKRKNKKKSKEPSLDETQNRNASVPKLPAI